MKFVDTKSIEYIKKYKIMNSISANLNKMIKAAEKASKNINKRFWRI